MITAKCLSCGIEREYQKRSHVRDLCPKCSALKREATPRSEIPLRTCERCGKTYRRTRPERLCRLCASDHPKKEKEKKEVDTTIGFDSEVANIKYTLKDNTLTSKGSLNFTSPINEIPQNAEKIKEKISSLVLNELMDIYKVWRIA